MINVTEELEEKNETELFPELLAFLNLVFVNKVLL